MHQKSKRIELISKFAPEIRAIIARTASSVIKKSAFTGSIIAKVMKTGTFISEAL